MSGVLGLEGAQGHVVWLYMEYDGEEFRAEGRRNSMIDLFAAVKEDAVQRIRHKIMSVCGILFGVLPIM